MGTMLFMVSAAVVIGIIVGKKAVDPHTHQEFEQVAKFAEDVGKDIDALTASISQSDARTKVIEEDYAAFKESATTSFTSFEETLETLQDVAGTLQHGFESVASKVDENDKRVESVAQIVHDKILSVVESIPANAELLASLSSRVTHIEVGFQSISSEMEHTQKAVNAALKKGAVKATKIELSAAEEPAES